MNKYCILIGFLLVVTVLLSGCIDDDTILPVTACQIIARSYEIDGVTHATCAKFIAGDYNNLLIGIGGPDNNVLRLYDVNSVGADVNWADLDFPAGCPAGSVVQVIGSTLTCVVLPTDTNVWTAGFMDVNNYWRYDFNVDGDILPSTSMTYNIGSGPLRWLNVFGSNFNADEVEVSGDVNVTGAVEATTYFGSNKDLTNDAGYITSYLDTNAETACGDGEFLRGDGTCQTITGDNLGNHVATMDINLNTQKIVDGNDGIETYFENGVFVVAG